MIETEAIITQLPKKAAMAMDDECVLHNPATSGELVMNKKEPACFSLATHASLSGAAVKYCGDSCANSAVCNIDSAIPLDENHMANDRQHHSLFCVTESD